MDLNSYQQAIRDDVGSCLNDMGVQPILFIGSGLSQRYYGGPSWDGLLETLAQQCPAIDRDFAYYKQRHQSPIDIGTIFSDSFREWAWGEGRPFFPAELFEASVSADMYIKYAVAEYFEALLCSENASNLSGQLSEELEALKNTRPHAIITTNYDRFLERLFPDYAPVIGGQILRVDYASIGEILKIHGCSSDPSSIVLTRSDYEEFWAKQKYLSAKLLTFFSEHPLVFLGYNAADPDIKAILSDIDEILAPAGELIPNIYLVEWQHDEKAPVSYPRERLISIHQQRSVRVKSIVAQDFAWVYDSFQVGGTTEAVDPRILRALMARTYELVRHDLPKRTIEVDYEMLEHALSSYSGLAKLYGITTLDDPSAVNAMYPYSLTQIGRELGFNGWHGANQLIKRIESERGVSIKQSDNHYHVAIMAGHVVQAHKYSQKAIDLLGKVRDGIPYKLHV